ncbi:MAG: PAS domain S-box protein [Candidatus Sericytochromatia bacterium]
MNSPTYNELLEENLKLKKVLQENKNDYKEIFEEASDAIFIANPSGYCIDVNENGCKIIGYTKEEILGKNIEDLLAKEESKNIQLDYEQLNNNYTIMSEYKMIHKDGKTIYGEISSKKLKNGNLIGIVRDITDKKLLEIKIKENELKFSKIFKLTPNAVSITSNKTGEIMAINDHCLYLTGYTKEELIGNTTLLANLWASPSERDRLISKLKKDGFLENEEVLVKSKDNNFYTCLLSAEFIELDNELYTLNLLQNITEQKKIQDILNREKKQLKTLIETIPDLVWFKDIKGVYLGCNHRFETLLGVKEIEIIGKTDYDFFTKELADFFRESDKKAIETNKPINNLEWVSFAEDNHTELVQTIITPLYDHSNNLIGILGIAHDMTKLYKYQEEIKKREELYSAIFNYANDSIALVDAETGAFIEFNEACYKKLGYTKEEFSKITVMDISAVNTKEEVFKKINFFKDSNSTFEAKHISKNKKIMDVRISVKGIELQNKKYLISLWSDITENKLKEAKLLELTNNLNTAQALAKIGSWSLDLKTNKLICSDEMFNIFEIEKNTFNYNLDSYLALIPPEEINNLSETYKESILNKKPYDIIHRLITKSGNVKYINEKCFTEYDENGKAYRSFGTSQDVTEKIIIESKLQESEKKLKTALKTAKLGYWEMNLKEQTASWSDETYEIFEEKKGDYEITFEKVISFVPDEEKEFLYKAYFDSIKNNTPYNIIHKIITKGGNIKYINERCNTEYDKDNNPIRSIGTSQDITERVKMELEIKLLNQELEKKVKERTIQLESANKDLEAFAYSVSHDLRAPLRHIDGFTNLLKMRLPVHNEESDKYINKIIDSSKRLSLMIEELLQFSRLGRKDFERKNVNLNELVHQIIEQYKLDFINRKIKFEIGELPNVLGDQILLHSVFENLISNAIKFTSKKDESIISIGLLKENEDLLLLSNKTNISSSSIDKNNQVIYIKDNGVGFNIEYIDKLFGVFQRLHNNDEFEGIGIGLANVKKIIKKHGWDIYAEGELNKGATFYIIM